MTKRHLKISLGLALGASIGYAYYALVGCNTGACGPTSDPVLSTGLGALVGFAFVSG